MNHEFDSDGEDVAATFAGGGSSFIVGGQEFDKDNFTLGVGVNFYSQSNFSAAIAYDTTIGDDYTSNVIQAKVYWGF